MHLEHLQMKQSGRSNCGHDKRHKSTQGDKENAINFSTRPKKKAREVLQEKVKDSGLRVKWFHASAQVRKGLAGLKPYWAVLQDYGQKIKGSFSSLLLSTSEVWVPQNIYHEWHIRKLRLYNSVKKNLRDSVYISLKNVDKVAQPKSPW